MNISPEVEEQWHAAAKELRQKELEKIKPKTEKQWRAEEDKNKAVKKARRSLTRTGTAMTYFIQGRTTGLIKIGKTDNLCERLATLQIGSPDMLYVVKTLSGNVEKPYHKRFAHLRQHGEWFSPAPELLEFIKKL